MSDQYAPQNRPGYKPEPDPYRSALRGDVPPLPPSSAPSGLGAGFTIALVFVVLAIIAIAAFSYNPGPAVTPAGDITIDNTEAPVVAPDPVPDAAAPDATAPLTAEPDAVAPAETAPEPAPDAAAPDAGTPDTGASDAAPVEPVDPAAPANP
jgi:hypothetical protein